MLNLSLNIEIGTNIIKQVNIKQIERANSYLILTRKNKANKHNGVV